MTQIRWAVVARALACLTLIALVIPMTPTPAAASPALSLSMITWGVIGLDSNDVTSGPNQFAEGARLCNSGTSAATDLTATFLWDSANAYISLYGTNPITVSSLAAGSCTDLYYNVQIQRTTSAYNTHRRFHIEVSGTGISTVSTPTPREVFVEKLVSQNRNTITSVTGPTTVTVGNTYTYVYKSKTATGGYEQMSTFLNWPNTIFQILSSSSTYTAPAGGTNDAIYADACGWDPDPTSVNYRSCVGPDQYTGGKAGGTMVTTYTVKVLSPGTADMGGLVYDFSGSSYHYNSDWSATYYSVTAVDSADVSITKSDSPDPVNAGQNVTYTLHVANAGPGTATGVTVSDPVPAGTSFVSADHGGTLSSGTVTWNVGSLANGASTDLHLVLTVNANRLADLSNTASVSTTTADPDATNDTDTETTTVGTSADLSITKSDSPDPVVAGQDLTYTLAVGNAGPSDAHTVAVTDVLPAGVSFVSATPSQGSCNEVAGTVTCDLGTVAVGATPSIEIVVTTSAGGTLSNTASVSSGTSDPDGTNDADTEDTTVTAVAASADLSITKSDNPDPVVAGTDLTYTLAVTNNGPAGADNTVLADDVPAGTSFVSADGGGTDSAGTVTWNLGTVANGATVTVHLVVHVDPARTTDLSNTASVTTTTADPDATNDTDTETTTVGTSADLSITKSDSPDPVVAGQDLTYTLAVGNAGPSDAHTVAVTDVLPAGVSFVSATPSQGSCNEVAGTVTCDLGTVAVGATPSIEIVVTTSAGGTLSNTASVSSGTSDPDGTNDADTEDTTVTAVAASADLSITKSDNPDPVVAGTDLTYTLAVTNNGPAGADNTVLADDVPAGTSFVSADGGGTDSAGTVTWNLGTVANGATVTVHLVVHVDPARTTDLSNTASVTTTTADPDATNDTDTETTTVGTSADLSITKSDSPDPVVAGQDLTYTLAVGNAGPSDAHTVAVTDVLPAGVSFVSATPSQGSCNEVAGTVTCDLGTVAVGATPSIAIVVTTSAGGTLSNTASVSSGTSDPDGTNDADTEDTTVTAVAASADLSITKSDNPDPVVAGTDLTYTLAVTNNGPAGADNTVLADDVPAGTSFVSADGGTESGGTVTWNLGTVANEATVTVHLVVHVDPARTTDLSNTASVATTTADPDATNDTDTETTTVGTSADLSITKSVSRSSVHVGGDLTYTLTVHNAGPSNAATVVVSDPLPIGVAFSSAVPSQGTCAEAAGVVTCQLGAIASGSDAAVGILVTTQASGITTNTATVSSATTDPSPSNDSDGASTTVSPRSSGSGSADVAVTKTSDVSRPVAGDVVTYTIVATDNGPDAATGVVITDALPYGLTYLSSHATQGQYVASTHEWTVGALANGKSASLVMRTRVAAGHGTAITNIASVARLDQRDPAPQDDRGTKSVQVLGESGSNDPNGGSGGTTASTGVDLQRSGLYLVVTLLLGVACVFATRRRRI